MKRWKIKFNLTYKIGLLIITAVLITSLTLNFIFRDHYKKDEIEHTEEHVMAMSRLEAPHFAHHILKNELQIMHKHIIDYTSAVKYLSDIQIDPCRQ